MSRSASASSDPQEDVDVTAGTLRVGLDLVCDEALLLSGAAAAIRQAHPGWSFGGLFMGSRWRSARIGMDHVAPIELPVPAAHEGATLAALSGEPVGAFLACDRFLSPLSKARQMERLLRSIAGVTAFLDEYQPHVYVSTGVAYMYNQVVMALCKRRGIPHISLYHARQPRSSMIFSLGNGGTWEGLEREYRRLVEMPSLPEAIGQKAREDLHALTVQGKQPEYMASIRQRATVTRTHIVEFVRRWNDYDHLGRHRHDDYITQHPLWYVRRDLKWLVRSRLQAHSIRSIFSDGPQPGCPYLLLPLQVEPEASTLILGRENGNLVELIRRISGLLPHPLRLAVKEHPSAFGRRDRAYYREIDRLANVDLVSPWAANRELIGASAGVVVLSGTMGWDAFLRGTPTYVFGDGFYRPFGGVYMVECARELVDRVVQSPRGSTEHERLVALAAIRSIERPGLFDVVKLDSAQRVMEASNVRAVGEAVVEFARLCVGSNLPGSGRDMGR